MNNNNFNENELLKGVYNNDDNSVRTYIPPETIDTYYKATINGFNFRLVHRIIGNRHEISILDSKGLDCINLYFIKTDDSNMLEEPLIPGLSYRTDCNIENNLVKGEGTKAMIKAILIFCIKTYPEYKYTALKDDSHFGCMLPSSHYKIELPLHIFSFIKYGKTWYEKEFDAVSDNKIVRAKLDHSIELLNKFVSGSFESFWDRTSMNVKYQDWMEKIKEDIQKIFEDYKDKQSWMNFFKSIFDKNSELVKKHGENISCTIFKMLLNIISNKFDLIHFDNLFWIIPKENIEKYPEFSTALFEKLDKPIVEKYKESKEEKNKAIKNINKFITHTVGGKRTRKYSKSISYLPKFYSSVRSYYDMRNKRQTRTKNKNHKITKKNKK